MNSVAKHLAGAADCLVDEWTEIACEIPYWAEASFDEIFAKINRIEAFKRKLEIITKAIFDLHKKAETGESTSDLNGLAVAKTNLEHPAQDADFNLEMLRAFLATRMKHVDETDVF